MATLEAATGLRERFYNDTRLWKRLVDFLIDTCRDLLREGEIDAWYSGYGHIVDAKTASQIAARVQQLMNKGVVKRREIELMIAFPPIRCGFCEGTGLKGKGKCTTCDGKGQIEQSFFSEDNVRAFAEFAKNSGGFDIY
jgi:hypothetical protein